MNANTVSTKLSEAIKNIADLREKAITSNLELQKEQISKDSPYSDAINEWIPNYDEFWLYLSLELKEAKVTRPALIKDIDPDLFIKCENKTNREIMRKGGSPYAYDSPEGKIELHHIGQDYNAPLAELTFAEHMMRSNNKILHISSKPSWRNDEQAEKDFETERVHYWKRRCRNDYKIIQTASFPNIDKYEYYENAELSSEIKYSIDELFKECTVEDLQYLADSAKSQILLKQMDVSSINEFIRTTTNLSETVKCVHCNSEKTILYGTYKTSNEKMQKYKCKSCNKIFTPMSNSIMSHSSFTFAGWIKFLDCIYNSQTVEQTAKVCKISPQAVQDNKMKLFLALKRLDDEVKLKGNIAFDETYFPTNFKGNRSNSDFEIPRETHKRGHENHKKGLSENQVCVICALDDYGNSVARVLGLKTSSVKKLKYALKDAIDKEHTICMYSDKSAALRAFAQQEELPIKQEKLLKKGAKLAPNVQLSRGSFLANYYLQKVNSYHSRLKKYIGRLNGVSSRLLSGYLYIFAWKERTKYADPIEAYKELISLMLKPDKHISIDDISQNNSLPDPFEIEKRVSVNEPKNREKLETLYARYAAGEKMSDIARDLGVSRQYISSIIKSAKVHGINYKTQHDVKKEQIPDIRRKPNGKCAIERDRQIYQERLLWTDPVNDFYRLMAVKYNISISRVKGIVAIMKRMESLKKEIFIFENQDYETIAQTYARIYNEYLALKQAGKKNVLEELQQKYGFSIGNIFRIISLMNNPFNHEMFKNKKKISTIETYNRDKALFIDFLKWEGSRKDFTLWAAKKYNLNPAYVNKIILLCLCADESRYDLL